VHNNWAIYGGGIYNTLDLSITGGEVFANTASLDKNKAGDLGGGIYSTGTLSMQGGSVDTNYAAKGAGLYIAGGTANFSHMTLTNNQADTVGGGFYMTGGTLTFDTCTIVGNRAPKFNGGSWAPGAGNWSAPNSTITNQNFGQDPNP
jgi:predicted outer membrane repeat protein